MTINWSSPSLTALALSSALFCLAPPAPCGEPLCGGRVPLDALPSPHAARSRFDDSLILRRPDPNELSGALDVPTLFRDLLRRDYSQGHYAGTHGFENLGDVLSWFRPALGSREALRARLEELRALSGAIHDELAWFLLELLDDRALRKPRWEGTENDPHDGFLCLQGWWPWHGFYEARWPGFGRRQRPRAAQVVTLIFLARGDGGEVSDACEALSRVRRVARSTDEFGRWRGRLAGYVRPSLVARSTWIAEDESAASYEIHYDVERFWLSDFAVEFRDTLSTDALITDYVCPDGPFRFFAGRDEFLPVHDASGAFVCLLAISTLATTELTPDVALRENLGNVKTLAESAAE